MRLVHALLPALLLGALFNCASSLKCYQCRTDLHGACSAGNLEPKYLKECPSRPARIISTLEPFCRVIRQVCYFTGKNEDVVIRECGFVKHHNPKFTCYKSKWPTDTYQYTCDCTTEGCNHAARRSRSSLLWLLAPLLLLAMSSLHARGYLGQTVTTSATTPLQRT